MKDSKYVICIDNSEYPASLERRKIYEVIPDPETRETQHIRVIDESGDDYLYPASYFVEINLSKETREAIARAA
jgi:hypothetical protein